MDAALLLLRSSGKRVIAKGVMYGMPINSFVLDKRLKWLGDFNGRGLELH